MSILLTTLFVYALGLLLTAVGSRLAGRCTTWCCALLGLPMWVVGGTVAPFCLALPQLMLAFLAAGMSVTALAVGTALAGAVANLGLALAVCLLNRRRYATADRDEFCRKCLLLLAACGVLAVSFVHAQVSGLWQYWQRMAQPCKKMIYRTPGPSTRPKVSTEWM